MKIIFAISLFTLFAFAVTANVNDIRALARINMTAKFQKKVKEITDKLAEPLVVTEKNIQLNNGNMLLDLTLSGSISGIKELTVKDLQVGLIGGLSISSFEFVLPKLSVDITDYDFDGKLGLTHIFGKGQIIVNLENIALKGSAKLGVKSIDDTNEKYAHITSITAGLSIDNAKFDFKITGWLNDEIRSEFMSNLITKIVQNMPAEYKPAIDKQISSILTLVTKDFVIPVKEILS